MSSHWSYRSAHPTLPSDPTLLNSDPLTVYLTHHCIACLLRVHPSSTLTAEMQLTDQPPVQQRDQPPRCGTNQAQPSREKQQPTDDMSYGRGPPFFLFALQGSWLDSTNSHLYTPPPNSDLTRRVFDKTGSSTR